MYGLIAVAFYFGARFGFDKADRKRLFTMINDLPTIFEVVTGTTKKHIKEKSSGSNTNNKSKSGSKGRGSEYMKNSKQTNDEGMDEDEEHGKTLCGACGELYASDEFWICCDMCEKWFHGKCVKITPARVQSTSNSISVRHVATRGHGLDIPYGCVLIHIPITIMLDGYFAN